MHFSFMEKFGGSILIVMWLVWGTNIVGDFFLPEPANASAIKIAGAPSTASATKVAKAAPQDALALLAKADPKRGAKVFNKCKACHTPNKGGKNRVGPNLWNVVGNKMANHAGYKYSSALSKKGGEWTFKNLDAFIASPRNFAKGTKMTFAGIGKATERAALLAYLRGLSDSPKPLP